MTVLRELPGVAAWKHYADSQVMPENTILNLIQDTKPGGVCGRAA